MSKQNGDTIPTDDQGPTEPYLGPPTKPMEFYECGWKMAYEGTTFKSLITMQGDLGSFTITFPPHIKVTGQQDFLMLFMGYLDGLNEKCPQPPSE